MLLATSGSALMSLRGRRLGAYAMLPAALAKSRRLVVDDAEIEKLADRVGVEAGGGEAEGEEA